LDRVLARLNSLHEAAAQDAAAATEAIAGRTTAARTAPSAPTNTFEAFGLADIDPTPSGAAFRRNSRQLGLLPGENDWQASEQRYTGPLLELPPPTSERMEVAYAAREAMARVRGEDRLSIAQRQQRLARRQSERAAAADPDRLERLGRDSHVLRRSFANHEDAFRQMDADRRRSGIEAAAAARAEARSEARSRVGGAAAAADPTRRHARLFASRSREYFERATRDYLASAESSDGNASNSSGAGAGTRRQDRAPSGLATADGPARPLPMIRTQSESGAATSVFLIEHAMSYLAALRGASSRDEGIQVALHAGFSYADIANGDFVLDVHTLGCPAPSSLLAPGARFAGNQYATAGPPEAASFAGEQTPPPPRRSVSMTMGRAAAGGARSSATAAAAAWRAPLPRPPQTPQQAQQQAQRERRWRELELREEREAQARAERESQTGTGATPTTSLLDVAAPVDLRSPTVIAAIAQAVSAAAGAAASASGGGGSGDDWPVKVSVFAVDYERMTLAASMEAFDVPALALAAAMGAGSDGDLDSDLVFGPWRTRNRPSGGGGARTSGSGSASSPSSGRRKAITTYLEGEIVDFATHSLVTESFPSTPARDAAGWRRLLPFRDVAAPELAARLVDRGWLETLGREYMLMRWKERCFVAAAEEGGGPVGGGSGGEEGCGLTISGFYYVSMRRADGHVEGLYCDPQSSPYQFLRLEREGRCAVAGWDFR
jgi:hypothetical protein